MALKRYFLKPIPGKEAGFQLSLEGSDVQILRHLHKKIILEGAVAYVKARGGSLVIMKENGEIEEERTYPRSADPKKSKG